MFSRSLCARTCTRYASTRTTTQISSLLLQSSFSTPAQAEATAAKCPRSSLNTPPIADREKVVTAKSFESIPGPKGLPLVGVLPDCIKYTGKMHLLYDLWHQQYGEVIRYNILGKSSVMFFNSNDIRDVYRLQQKTAFRGPVDPWIQHRNERNLPYGITQIKGDEWRRHRTVANKLLLPEVVSSYVPRVVAVAKDFVGIIERSLNDKGELEIPKIATSTFGLEAIVAVMLGRRSGLLSSKNLQNLPEDHTELMQAVHMMFLTSEKLLFSFPTWKIFPNSTLKKHYESWDAIFRIARTFLNGESFKGMEFIKDGTQNFVDHVRASTDLLSEKEILVMSTELVTGGIDTTGVALMTSLYHIASNPTVQERIYQELKQVMGKDQELTVEHWENLKYLRSSIQEALRLHPVIPTNVRIFEEEVVIGGYQIPPKVPIQMNKWTTNRSSSFFEEPLSFDPEKHADDRRLHLSTFGAGARMCPGKRLANMELEVVMAHIVRQFKMDCSHFPPIESKLLMSLVVDKDHPYYIKFEKRAQLQ